MTISGTCKGTYTRPAVIVKQKADRVGDAKAVIGRDAIVSRTGALVPSALGGQSVDALTPSPDGTGRASTAGGRPDPLVVGCRVVRVPWSGLAPLTHSLG